MQLWPILLLALSAPNEPTPVGETWPQWRGPTGDSVSPSRDLPVRWGETENVIWKTNVPGWGTSSPAIWRDAIFVTTQDEDRLLLLRIDRKTGAIVYQKECTRGLPRRQNPLGNGRFHDEHNMASPSPVTDGNHVWVHFGNGTLTCYTFAGDKVWATNLVERFGPYTIWWGHANSPVLFGDLLISVCMQDPKGGGKSYVVAHEKETGKERWYVERDTGATSEPADSYTTPVFRKNKDQTEMIVHGGNVLDAYDPATGKRLWQCKPFSGNRVIAGPTVIGDTILAVQGMKGPLFAIQAGGSGDVTSTHVRWKFSGGTTDAASPVTVNGLIFLAGTSPGTVVCLDAPTGKELWKERLSTAFRATPLIAGDRVYFFGKEGKITVIHAAPAFQSLSQFEMDEQILASPAVAGNDLFVRTKDHLYRIGSGARH